MVRILIIRPGVTDFDEQGRIKGTLDIPLSEAGNCQVTRIVEELSQTQIEFVYSSPCRCALQTAEALATSRKLRVKKLEDLQNLDHGLWHGKLFDEVKQTQPKVYRQLQEHPETVCPPDGEPVSVAIERVNTALNKLLKKHKSGVVALIVPEPIASIARCLLEHAHVGDLWRAERECGSWESLDVDSKHLLTWRGVVELVETGKT